MKSFLILILAVGSTVFAADKTDKELVREAVEDYVLGVYNVQPERIKRSVHADMTKIGYYERDGEYREIPMTFQQLVKLAGNWNKDGSRANKDSIKEITIFEVMDKTASAKVVAEWGQDYFHLIKEDGNWKILHVLWQSIPK